MEKGICPASSAVAMCVLDKQLTPFIDASRRLSLLAHFQPPPSEFQASFPLLPWEEDEFVGFRFPCLWSDHLNLSPGSLLEEALLPALKDPRCCTPQNRLHSIRSLWRRWLTGGGSPIMLVMVRVSPHWEGCLRVTDKAPSESLSRIPGGIFG